MSKGRLEAFSDGVLAIIITIMVLQLETPSGATVLSLPVALYGVVLLLAAGAYYLLVRTLIVVHGSESPLGAAVGGDVKGKVSILIYVVAIGVSFLSPFIAWALYVAVALIWLVPDRRIEKTLAS